LFLNINSEKLTAVNFTRFSWPMGQSVVATPLWGRLCQTLSCANDHQ
jgi:hypothetical protein